MSKVLYKKGLKADLPSSGLIEGCYYQCTDTGELYLATSSTTKIAVGVGDRIHGFLMGDTLVLELSDKLDYDEEQKTIFINSPSARYDEQTNTVII